ncbi:MAG: hypothetical protein ACR2NZ_12345 [Rubripirellula sp.]
MYDLAVFHLPKEVIDGECRQTVHANLTTQLYHSLNFYLLVSFQMGKLYVCVALEL